MHRRVLIDLLRPTGLLWLVRNRVTRVEVIQHCVDALRARTYLEIGVAEGSCFCSVTAPMKVGVDPIAPANAVTVEMESPGVSYYATTSDDFFRTLAPRVLAEGADVVFIDGLHTFSQAYRDCSNALRYLSPSGVILLHDCLPANQVQALVADSYQEAAKLADPSWNGEWTGDVWKAIVALRANHREFETHVLSCDRGIGFVRRGKNRCSLSGSTMSIGKMTYADLMADADRLLGLRLPVYLAWAMRMRQCAHSGPRRSPIPRRNDH